MNSLDKSDEGEDFLDSSSISVDESQTESKTEWSEDSFVFSGEKSEEAVNSVDASTEFDVISPCFYYEFETAVEEANRSLSIKKKREKKFETEDEGLSVFGDSMNNKSSNGNDVVFSSTDFTDPKDEKERETRKMQSMVESRKNVNIRILPECPRTVCVGFFPSNHASIYSASEFKVVLERRVGQEILECTYFDFHFYVTFVNLSALNLLENVDEIDGVYVFFLKKWENYMKEKEKEKQLKDEEEEDEGETSAIDHSIENLVSLLEKPEAFSLLKSQHDFDIFPVELWRRILLFVPPRFLFPDFMIVSKAFHAIFKHEGFYKELLEAYWNSINPDLLSDATFRLLKTSYKKTFVVTMNRRLRHRVTLRLISQFRPYEAKGKVTDCRYFLENITRIREKWSLGENKEKFGLVWRWDNEKEMVVKDE